jgi:hypothetical protein
MQRTLDSRDFSNPQQTPGYVGGIARSGVLFAPVGLTHPMEQSPNIVSRYAPILARTICPVLFVDSVAKSLKCMS